MFVTDGRGHFAGETGARMSLRDLMRKTQWRSSTRCRGKVAEAPYRELHAAPIVSSARFMARAPYCADSMPVIGTTQQIASST